MITNPTLQILNSFAKMKLPEKEVKPKSMGMMSRSKPPAQKMSSLNEQPAMRAKEIQMHIRNSRNKQKNGGTDDGRIV
tara:strand:- start:103 stop:336 length:234 start_codon:yes stop_codon:yes gene_type:complete